jgi:hypothetical protein
MLSRASIWKPNLHKGAALARRKGFPNLPRFACPDLRYALSVPPSAPSQRMGRPLTCTLLPRLRQGGVRPLHAAFQRGRAKAKPKGELGSHPALRRCHPRGSGTACADRLRGSRKRTGTSGQSSLKDTRPCSRTTGGASAPVCQRPAAGRHSAGFSLHPFPAVQPSSRPASARRPRGRSQFLFLHLPLDILRRSKYPRPSRSKIAKTRNLWISW